MEGYIVDEVGALCRGAKQASGPGTRELKEESSRNVRAARDVSWLLSYTMQVSLQISNTEREM